MAFDLRKQMKNYVPAVMEDKKICIYGMGEIWDTVRRMYMNLAKIDLACQADFLVDKNPVKHGRIIGGKKVCTPEEITWEDCVVFITSHLYRGEIADSLFKRGLRSGYNFYEPVYLSWILYEYLLAPSIALKGRHSREKCFIVGCGPSLTPEDLDKLHEHRVTSFAPNQIYKIFNKTKWRPSYYVASDLYAISNYEVINRRINCPKFMNLSSAMTMESFNIENAYFFVSNDMPFNLIRLATPEVGTHIYDINTGGASTFICIQLALYLGFSEIYLLGVDNAFSASKMNDGELILKEDGGHFVNTKDYFSDFTTYYLGDGIFDEVYIQQVNLAFKSAADYAAKHGVTIRNASRAGTIDALIHVDFDNILKG